MEKCLELEREAELEESANLLAKFSLKVIIKNYIKYILQELEKRNKAVTKLFIKHVSTGIFGKSLLHLTRQKYEQNKQAESNANEE